MIISLEIFISRKRNLAIYDFHESFSHFFNGVGQQILNLVWFGVAIFIYGKFQLRFSLFEFSSSSIVDWTWVMLLTDFCWYWGHRVSHRCNLFLASHDTHHQARDFNHASALRQSWSSRPFMFIFFLPLAFLGVSFEMALIAQFANTFLQFLTHNGVYMKPIPLFDWIFVIPRTHKIHHGNEAPYLDKNFGGVLILWDRIFGTYTDLVEGAELKIGPHHAFNHLDAWQSNVQPFQRLWRCLKSQKSLANQIRILFGTPESLEAILSKSLIPGIDVMPLKRKFTDKLRTRFYSLVLLQIASVLTLMIAWKELSLVPRIALCILTFAAVLLGSKMLYMPKGLSHEI